MSRPALEPRKSFFLSIFSRWPLSLLYGTANRVRYKVLALPLKAHLTEQPDKAVIPYYDAPSIAQKLSIPSRGNAFGQNLDLIISLLEKNEIPYFVIPDESVRKVSVGVFESNWRTLVQVLEDHAQVDLTFFVGLEVTSRQTGKIKSIGGKPDSNTRTSLHSQKQIQCYRLQTDYSGQSQFARECSVTISKWVRTENGDIVTSSPNRWSTSISQDNQTLKHLHFQERVLPTFEFFTRKHVFEIREPVDAVYMWVDGADEMWRAKRDTVIEKITGSAAPDSIDPSRFRDNGELKYSLRSLNTYADWIRRIYLVTDNQIPDWLDVTHQRIQLVDHKEIFGNVGTLPTFNSHAIASRIHHIDGLAEKYLILNDDVFFGSDTEPNLFFEPNGISRFFLSKSVLALDSAEMRTHESARNNVRQLIQRDFGVSVGQTFFHTPVPQQKSILFDLEKKYRNNFEETWNNQLRSANDLEINGWLHHYYAYLIGRALPGSIRYGYFDLKQSDLKERLQDLLISRNTAVFCVNDHPDATAQNLNYFAQWLEQYFPVAAPWEK